MITRNGIQMLPTKPERLELLDKTCAEQRRYLNSPLWILEIGSLDGTSAKVLAQYGAVTCVDIWDFPNGLETFKHNVAGLLVAAVHGSSAEILPQLERRRYDFIYIDGDHTYPIVLTDMLQSRDLVTENGIICGDDLEKQLETPADIDEAVAHKYEDFYKGYHPGVSLAVYQVFGRVNEKHGFWWL